MVGKASWHSMNKIKRTVTLQVSPTSSTSGTTTCSWSSEISDLQCVVGAPFVPFLREAHEMTWLWKSSLALDNAKLTSLIGEEPHTPLDEAVGRAIDAAQITDRASD